MAEAAEEQTTEEQAAEEQAAVAEAAEEQTTEEQAAAFYSDSKAGTPFLREGATSGLGQSELSFKWPPTYGRKCPPTNNLRTHTSTRTQTKT